MQKDYPEYIKSALKFIRAWQNGRITFSLKTSGSTGAPKPFVLKRHVMKESAAMTALTFRLDHHATLLCCLSSDYIAGMMMIARALVLECNLVIMEPSGNPYKNMPCECGQVTFAAFVPMQMKEMLENDAASKWLVSLGCIILGGGEVPQELMPAIKDINVPVYHTYGMTETYTHIARRRLNGIGNSPEYVPFKGIVLGKDSRGCLTIWGRVTENKVLVTNDMVDLHTDQTFRWLGRWDNIINSGGIKIHPEEAELWIARALEKAGYLDQKFIISGLPDPRLGQKVVLIIEGTSWSAHDIDKVLKNLTEKLPRYHAPREIVFMDNLKITASGKVDRKGTMELVKKITTVS